MGCVMAQFTKKAIIDAFIELIGERPFDKITVKDIVTRCGVNRNTLYYYFEDIYALVDELFKIETQNILGDTSGFDSWQDAFLKAVDFVRQNRLGICHMYKSISRERVEDYLDEVTYNNILSFIKKEAEGINADESDIELIARFYAHALVGMVLEWLSSGMKGDMNGAVERLGVLLDGNIRLTLSNSEKSMQTK